MTKPLLSLIGLALSMLSLAAKDVAYPTEGTIDRLDPALGQLLAPDARMEKLAEGFTWSEGPLWYKGALIFSDVPQNTVYRWTPGATKAEVFLKPSGLLKDVPGFREPGSNGLALDRQGRLLLCQHGERRVARYEDGKFSTVADRIDGKRLNTPNDLAVRKNGDVYFTDPPYGFDKLDESPLAELGWHGVYRVTADGKVTLLTKTLRFPNGIAFSPDEKTLYVGLTETNNTHIVAFDVKADGTLANERMFLDARPLSKKDAPGSCDGMKVDREGNVWTSGPGGILIVSPTGKLIGRLNTGVPTANCAWGDDGSTLYITANHALLRIQTKTKGAGW
ncbi:MAG: SMP-30/gluconolactonase/LRE family protein [Opitutus sp.]